jgi:hypothetical protein
LLYKTLIYNRFESIIFTFARQIVSASMNFKTIISLNLFILLFTFNSNAQLWKCKKKKNVKTEISENSNQDFSQNFKVVKNKYEQKFAEIDSLIDFIRPLSSMEKSMEKLKVH